MQELLQELGSPDALATFRLIVETLVLACGVAVVFGKVM